MTSVPARAGENAAVEAVRQGIGSSIFGLSPEKCIAAAYPIIAEAVRAEERERIAQAIEAGDFIRPLTRRARSPRKETTMSTYDFEARYVVRTVVTYDDRTEVTATLDPHPSNRIAVMAGDETCYGFEDVSAVEVRFTVARQPNYIAVGDVVKIQSSHLPPITPKPLPPVSS